MANMANCAMDFTADTMGIGITSDIIFIVNGREWNFGRFRNVGNEIHLDPPEGFPNNVLPSVIRMLNDLRYLQTTLKEN